MGVEMPCTNISPAATAAVTPISMLGTDSVYVELHMRRLGAVIELRAIAVEYNAYTGRYLRDELGCELVCVEEAIDAAVDLQHLTNQHLDERGDRGYAAPCGFGEPIEKALDTEEMDDANDVPEWAGVIYPTAAE
jgi:hypothetical protein